MNSDLGGEEGSDRLMGIQWGHHSGPEENQGSWQQRWLCKIQEERVSPAII